MLHGQFDLGNFDESVGLKTSQYLIYKSHHLSQRITTRIKYQYTEEKRLLLINNTVNA